MIDTAPDMARMRRQRSERLRTMMAAHDVEVLLLAAGRNVEYATGFPVTLDDAPASRRSDRLAMVAGDGVAWLVDASIDDDPAAALGAVVEAVAGRGRCRLGVDEFTVPLLETLRSVQAVEVVDATPVMRDARIVKTVDEISCIRAAQRINEAAVDTLRGDAVPGVSETVLTERFLRRIFQLGAAANLVDPVWQSMTATAERTRFGQPAYPAPPRGRVLADGDIIWVDTGVAYGGYSSDLGVTWPVGASTAAHRDDFRRWREVTDLVLGAVCAGARGSDLVNAARAATDAPWLRHLYLAHGLGMNSSEPPLLGTTDPTANEVTLESGMVLVVEPVIWAEGGGGYRAEEMVRVTDDGYEMLSRRIDGADG
jgi:Xaa-Pro dipeptidase